MKMCLCAYVFVREPVPWLCVEQQVQKCPRVLCFVDVRLLRVRLKSVPRLQPRTCREENSLGSAPGQHPSSPRCLLECEAAGQSVRVKSQSLCFGAERH